ncbi:MAG: DnaD domain protein [Eubacterium sp.]|nr:DnaD domain protein [Candidatus Colimonas fimequi]
MAFYREKVDDYFLLDTRVENMFINEYMAGAPGDAVKVYLLAQMYADLGIEITNEEIGRSLNIEVEDVLRAWTYWDKTGVIRKVFSDPADRLKYDVEFVNLKEQLYGSKSSTKSYVPAVSASMADKAMQDMINAIEQITGNLTNGVEMQEIMSWTSDYVVDPELIIYAYKYAHNKKNKVSMKYVEGILKNWSEAGIHDVAGAEKMLAEQDRKSYLYKRVLQALGFNRNATEAERRLMDTWFDDMEFSLEAVLEACEKTTGIANPNFNYINAVLVNSRDAKKGVDDTGKHKDVTVGEVTRYYELLRASEEKAAEARRQEVFAKVPEIKEIEDKLNVLAAKLSKLIISDRIDKKEAMDEIKDEIDSLNFTEAFLLTDNGFELNHMEIQYNCNKCKDTGILETGERCQCFGEVTKEKIDLMSKQAK